MHLGKNLNLPIDEFNAMEEAKHLVSFVKAEKSYFLNCLKGDDLNQSVLVRPKHSNRQIVAQNWAFILFGLNDRLVRSNASNSFAVIKLAVRKDEKNSILTQLAKLGFNDEAMFPELESATKYIRSQFSER